MFCFRFNKTLLFQKFNYWNNTEIVNVDSTFTYLYFFNHEGVSIPFALKNMLIGT